MARLRRPAERRPPRAALRAYFRHGGRAGGQTRTETVRRGPVSGRDERRRLGVGIVTQGVAGASRGPKRPSAAPSGGTPRPDRARVLGRRAGARRLKIPDWVSTRIHRLRLI